MKMFKPKSNKEIETVDAAIELIEKRLVVARDEVLREKQKRDDYEKIRVARFISEGRSAKGADQHATPTVIALDKDREAQRLQANYMAALGPMNDLEKKLRKLKNLKSELSSK
jgi:hypothetical protein